MSSSGGDGKPSQTGLVDMGDISFYNNPAAAVPFSTLLNSDLGPFPGLFGEIVLNVTWAQLQPTQERPARSVVRHPRRDPGRRSLQSAIRHGPRHQAACVGRFHGARLGQEHQRAAHRGHRQGRQSPDGRSILDRRLHRGLDQSSEPARHRLGRQRSDPRHFQHGRRLGDRRTVHIAQQQRHRRAAGRGLHRRRPAAHPARRDRRLFPMVDDAARLHDEPLSSVRQRPHQSRCELHARRPAAGAGLDARSPGRQPCPEQPMALGRRLHLFPDAGRCGSRSRGHTRQLSDRLAEGSLLLWQLARRRRFRRRGKRRRYRAVGRGARRGPISRFPWPQFQPGAGPGHDPCRRHRADNGRTG